MPVWVSQGFEEYARRFNRDCQLELREIPQAKVGNVVAIKNQEGEKLIRAIPRGSQVIGLDVQGQKWSTPTLAEQLQKWKASGQDICLLIGGPEGLSSACLERAAQCWSLSPLTFPHPLVRVIVAEQLYRAESILRGHPYHRA